MDLKNSKFVLELLTKALEFYGEKNNYIKINLEVGSAFVASSDSPIEEDKGTIARETIRNISEILKVGE